jgi:hypothetical protein
MGGTYTDCDGTVTYTWTYEDCYGHSHDWTYTFNIVYQDFMGPEDDGEIVDCFGDVYQPTPPTVYDNCGVELIPTGPVMGGTYTDCDGTVTYTWTYEDCYGHSHDWTYTFNIVYEDFMGPEDDGEIVDCFDDVYQPTPPTVYDNCGVELIPTGPVMGGTYTDCDGTVTYTWTYEDCFGHSHDWTYTFNIVYEDFLMPPDDSENVQCYEDVYMPTPPTVLDNCGVVLIPTGPAVNEDFDGCDGFKSFIWTYEDCFGHTHDWIYTFFIEDTTDPVLEPFLDPFVFECGETPEFPDVTEYSDNCTPYLDLVVHCEIVDSEVPCSEWIFPIGTTYVRYWVEDLCGNTSEPIIVEIVVEPCEDYFCSLTMGGWGNYGGSYCWPFGFEPIIMPTLDLLNGIWPGQLVVGTDYSLTIHYAATVIDWLPGGGRSVALTQDYEEGDNDAEIERDLIKNGRFNNNLLGQTVALTVNTWYTPYLATLTFDSQYFWTRDIDVCAGEEEGSGDWMSWAFSDEIWYYFGGEFTVADLLALANAALGGEDVGIGLGEIGEAVAVINEAFVECKEFTDKDPYEVEDKLGVSPAIDMVVSPNPFKDEAAIRVTSKVDTDLTVEIYNMTGLRVETLYDGPVNANEIYSFRFNTNPFDPQQFFMVVVRTPNSVTSTKMLKVR